MMRGARFARAAAAATPAAARASTVVTTGAVAMIARAATRNHSVTTGHAWSEEPCRKDRRTVKLGQTKATVPRILGAQGPGVTR